MSSHLERHLTPDEIAQALQISRRYVMKEIRAGKLPAIRCGNRVRVSPDALRAWLKRAEGVKQ